MSNNEKNVEPTKAKKIIKKKELNNFSIKKHKEIILCEMCEIQTLNKENIKNKIIVNKKQIKNEIIVNEKQIKNEINVNEENIKNEINVNEENIKNEINVNEEQIKNEINVNEKNINITNTKCNFENCDKKSIYNYASELRGFMCKKHKLENMINVKTKRCIGEYCMKQPSFNYPNEKTILYCNDHKLVGMINISSIKKLCVIENCPKRAGFNFKTESNPKYCFKHKTTEMVNIANKLCECNFENCTIRASYNIPTLKKGIRCSLHAENNMIDVVSKKCEYEKCIKLPCYNYSNKKSRIRCVEHKLNGMIDITKSTCTFENCPKRPNFNLKGEKKAVRCATHKTHDMIDVRHVVCDYPDCKILATYNIPSILKPQRCFTHKEPNMISSKKKIKCKNINTKCLNISTHGYKNSTPQFCETHALTVMINLIHENKCSQCENSYEFIDNEIKYCIQHHPNKNLENVIKRLCKYCDLQPESDFTCSNCKNVVNKKEYFIVRFLKKHIQHKSINNSSSMLDACAKNRPDIFYDLGTHCIIVEVDENQHKNYDESCECSRINNIVSGLGMTTIFIRFNPDQIKHKNKEIIMSHTERLQILIKVINDEINTHYDSFKVKLIQLFFNDSNENYSMIKEEFITHKVSI